MASGNQIPGDDMRLHLPGLIREKLPSGSFRYRVRVEGKKWLRIKLPVGLDDPTFLAHYHAARAGKTLTESQIIQAKKQAEQEQPIEHSVAWLTLKFEDWMAERVDNGQMHPGTMKQRIAFFERLRAEYGTKGMNMPRGKLIEFRDSMMSTPGAADNMIKAIRACYAWAKERDIVEENPAIGISKINDGDGAIPWSIDDLQQYKDRHPTGTMAHLALTIFMFTACRISDAVLFGRKHEKLIGGINHLSWQPAKKGSAKVTIPILPPLKSAINSMTVVGPTYLLNDWGQPFASSASFGNKFRDWVREADLKDRSSHGIRKAAGELMALSGASQYHIMAVHGHTQAKTSEVYTSGVNRQKLAAEAMDLMAGMAW